MGLQVDAYALMWLVMLVPAFCALLISVRWLRSSSASKKKKGT